jgi:hypothetical protein
MRILIEVSPGELFDRLTILAIKERRLGDPDKLAAVRRERALLEAACSAIERTAALGEAIGALATVNETLWDIEDRIREHERDGRFDDGFVELARAVYVTNDERARLKGRINALLGTDIPEAKQYTSY